MANDDTLADVAALASRRYDTPDDALEAVLAAAQRLLGYQTVLMSQVDREQSLLRIHAVLNTDPGLTVPPGLQIPLTASPCQHVAASIEPFAAGDMHRDPGLALLPAAKDMGATAYLGVPVVLGDGTFFGTLVGLDTRVQDQRPAQAQWLQVLARIAAGHVERQGVAQLVPA